MGQMAQLHADAEAVHGVGHNHAPDAIDLALPTITDISKWMEEHPVIEDEATALAAKPLLDRAKVALDEIEKERDGKVRPLNTEVAEINSTYKALHNTEAKKPGTYDRVVGELKSRFAAYLKAEEDKRFAAAEAARLEREAAEKAARDAEAKEQEAIANAAAGELGVDVAAVTQEADAAFTAFETTSRFAARAERDTKVKVGGGFGRAVTLRTVETLHLDSYNLALKAIGPHDKIKEAILSAAREYRTEHGHLPDGVRATQERAL